MKKSLTKAAAMLCATAMILGTFSVSAFADDIENDEEVEESVEVSEEVQVDADMSTAKTLLQADIDALNGTMPVISGEYVLGEDLAVSDTAQIEEDGADITIDLNGYTITYSGSGSMYIVGKVNGWNIVAGNVTLTFEDNAGGGLVTVASGYTGGGSDDHWISGGTGFNADRGGCVLVQNSSTFILRSGTISGFHSGDEGGAVHCSNGSFFKMYGGKITNCTSANGGAVSVHASSNGRTKTNAGITYNIQGAAWIYGGEISGNTATNLGGGIRVCRADLYLYGGVITGNTVTNGTGVNGGGGVQVLKAKKDVQYLEVQGNVQIVGNHCAAEAKRANLFFNEDTTFDLSGDLASTAKIAFGEASEKTTVKFFTINGYSYSEDNFICDNSGYYPYYNSSNDAIMMKKSDKPEIKGYTLVVGGEIALNTYIALGSFANSNTTVSYSYSYDKSGTPKTVEGTIAFSELVLDSNSGYYKARIPVESACMTSEISVVVNYGTSGEATYQSTTIEEYANQVINGQYTAEAKAVAEALLIYGGYAQIKFDINTGDLPTFSGADFTATPDYGLVPLNYTPGPGLTGVFAGATLSMLSQTNINLFFEKSAFTGSAPVMTVTYNGGATETITAKNSGNYYVYTVKGASGMGISARKYNETFSYEIGGLSGQYSILTYLTSAKYNSSDNDMKNLVEAYYNFAVKCVAYANSLTN